jgi:penicillin-binding protein 1A
MFRFLGYLFALVMFGAILVTTGVLYALWRYTRDLPDYQQLAEYEPPVVTRVHAGDGRLLAEYAIEKRVFVPVAAIPKQVVKAFIAAEDKNFYSHSGVDFLGILRAGITNIRRSQDNRRPGGASTITQQVAKNFLLTNEISVERKIKEAVLSFRIERAFTKERILELYLNEIYLGFGSYGVAAAALNYFNKSLDELTVAESAFLAALPKAPNNYNPTRNPDAAKGRRDWVIARMLDIGFITEPEAAEAMATPITLRQRDETEVTRADYFAEEVRRILMARYGESGLYKGGLSVRTTLDPRLQVIADRALKQGLVSYDRRHGWRGASTRLDAGPGWRQRLEQMPLPPGLLPGWRQAIVLSIGTADVTIGLTDGKTGRIPMAELRWARRTLEEQRVGPPVTKPSDVLNAGDVILVEAVTVGEDKKPYPADTFGLRQIPDLGGALLAMDPHTGRVLAMSGGWSYEASQYNRATQANRQPGSSFKPFVYLAGLLNGYTPSTIIDDSPFVVEAKGGAPKWEPKNYGNDFLGPVPMRVGIEKSRNLMTVRLADAIGMDKVVDVVQRFGVIDKMPPYLAMSLGAGETTLLRMTTAYAMIDNGGKRITPSFIDRIQDRHGRVIFKHDTRACRGCSVDQWRDQKLPVIPDTREQVTDPVAVYQMVSMMQGVIQRGTAGSLASMNRPLAGKTGTTNEGNDLWFVGFSPDLVVGVYVGFDNPYTLGARETGGSAAVPIFRAFMTEALAEAPIVPFRVPPGVRLVRVDPATGQLASAGDRGAIFEAYRPGTEPGTEDDTQGAVGTGTGGLY